MTECGAWHGAAGDPGGRGDGAGPGDGADLHAGRAEFIVSPALHLRTVQMCQRYRVAVLPGALTPTDIVTAWQARADVVKVFPASAMGGASYLKSVRAPLPQVKMIPTGGVSLATAREFLEAGAFALGVGADLVDPRAMDDEVRAKVTGTARKYLEIVGQFRGCERGPASENSAYED